MTGRRGVRWRCTGFDADARPPAAPAVQVGQRVLDTLDAAEAALPAQEKTRSLLPFF